MRIIRKIKNILFRTASTLFKPAKWLYDYFSNGFNIAGVSVNEESTMSYPAIFSAVRCISQTIAMLPLVIYKRTGNGKEKAIEHPLYQILHLRPNPYMPKSVFIQLIIAQVLLWGNGFAEITINNRGEISGLYPRYPSQMRILRDENDEIYYEYSCKKGLIKYPYWKILHIVGFSFDGLAGESVISLFRKTIGAGLSINEFELKFFENGVLNSFVIKHQGELKDDAFKRLKKEIKENYLGLVNAHIPMLLEDNMTIEKISMSLEDAQFIQQKKFSIEDVCRIFRVPPHKVMHLERATFSNIEEQNREFINDSILPWITLIEEVMNWDLFLPRERVIYYIKFLLTGLLRGTQKDRYDSYHQALNDGWMNKDEVREKEDLNEMPDGLGKMYVQQLSMASIETIQLQYEKLKIEIELLKKQLKGEKNNE